MQTVIKYNRHRPGNDRFVLTDAHMLVCPHTTCMPPQTSVCVLHSSPVSAQSGICSRTTDASQAWSRLKKSSTLTICSFGACSENRFFFSFFFSSLHRRAGYIFLSITTLHIKERTESSEYKGLHRVRMLISCLGQLFTFCLSVYCRLSGCTTDRP